jgi:hypothetical protein
MPRLKGSKVVDGKVIPPTASVMRDPFAVLDQEIKVLESTLDTLRNAKATLAKLWASNT